MKRIALAALLGLQFLSVGPTLAQDPPTRAIVQGIDGKVGEEIRELRRMGFPMRRISSVGGRTEWLGERPTARVRVTAERGIVTASAMDIDLVEAIVDEPLAVEAAADWQQRYVTEAIPSIDGVISEGMGTRGGMVVQGGLLDDRRLRVAVAAGPTHLDIRVAKASKRFVVRSLDMARDRCRAVDPRTGEVADRLVVPVTATVIDPGGPKGRLWVVVYDEDPVERLVEVRDLSWGPPGIVTDAATRTVVFPGPPIGRGEELDLGWNVVLPDRDRHEVSIWLVPGPVPDVERLDEQAAAVREGMAIDTAGGAHPNEVCAPTTEDPVLAMVREHLAASVLALRQMRERARVVDAKGDAASVDERLAPLAEMRDWAVAERAWADDEIPARMRSDHPSLTEWRTMVGVAGVLLTDVVATRIEDADAAAAALLSIDSVLDSIGPRVAQELAPEDEPEQPDPSPGPPVIALGG